MSIPIDNIANLKTQLRPLLSQDDLLKHTKKRANRSLSQEREDFERRILQNITSELQKWFELILKENPINSSESTAETSTETPNESSPQTTDNNQTPTTENNTKTEDFFPSLKDGVILCKVLQIVDKKFAQQKFNQSPKTPGNMLDNIALFINGCEEFGVKISFNSVDIIDSKNIKNVVASLHAFGLHANRLNFSPLFQTNFSDIPSKLSDLFQSLENNNNENNDNNNNDEDNNNGEEKRRDLTASDALLVDTLVDLLQSSETTTDQSENTNENDEESNDDSNDENDDENNDKDIENDNDNENEEDGTTNNDRDDDEGKFKMKGFKKNTDLGMVQTIDELLNEINRLKAELKKEKKLRVTAETKLKKYKEKRKTRSISALNNSSNSNNNSANTKEVSTTIPNTPLSPTPTKKSSAIKLKAASKLKRISTYHISPMNSVNNNSSNNEAFSSFETLDEIKELKEKREMIRKQKEDQLKMKLSSKEQRLRLNVLLEISNTEKDYVEDLKIIIRAQNGLLNDKIITITDVQTIFSNIQQILGIHEEMSKAFEERLFQSENSEEQCWNASIGDIMIKYSDFFKMYTTYVGNQSAQNQLADQFLHHSKSFVTSLLRHCPEFESKQVVLVSFHSCLIKPIQRICKYPLLLKELLRYTEDDHPDKENLEKAFSQLQSITTFINQKKKESENFLKLLEIQEAISDLPKNFSIVGPDRTFIREANLIKISKGRAQERHFYLFNDLIVYGAKPMIKSNRLTFKGKILLQMLLVNDLPDTPDRKFTFEIVRLDHKKKKYIICAKELPEKLEWMNDISRLVNSYLAEDKNKKLTPQTNEGKGNLQQIREISEELDDLEAKDISGFDQKQLADHNEKISSLQMKLSTLKKAIGTDLDSQLD